MWLWYAYELDAAANGGVPKTIAVGCQPASNNGRCYFKDLAQWLQNRSKKNPRGQFVPDVGVGTDLTPDVIDTANKLRTGGYKSNWDPKKLLPASKLVGLNPGFGQLFKTIHNSVQDIRSTLARPLTADMQDMEDRIKLAMQGVHEMRIADMALSNFFTELEGFLDYPLIRKTPQKLAIDGTTLYDELDHDANEVAHSGYKAAYASFLTKCEDPDIKESDNSFWKKFNKDTNIMMHHNAIVASQAIESSLHEFRTPTGDLCILPV